MVPFAKNFIDIMVFFTAVLIGAGITFALSLTGIIELALLGALVYAVGLIVGTMFIASFNFARMEKEI